MVEADEDRIVPAALVTVAVLVVLGALLDDPVGLGSTDFYAFTAMGIGFAAWRIQEVDAPTDRAIVGLAATAGGLLIGVGTLPVSSPATAPLVVGGSTVAEGGAVSVVGFCLFFGSLLHPIYREGDGTAE